MGNPITFRPTQTIDEYIEQELLKDKKKTKSEIIIELCEDAINKKKTEGIGPSQPTIGALIDSIPHETPLDYENWYSDCEYGTYFKDKKKVHCACTFPSVRKWMPKDRLVDPQVCDRCFPRIEQIKEFIQKRQEERQALEHTGKYFTNEKGQRIPY